MSKRQSWLVLILRCKLGKLCDHVHKFLADKLQRLCHNDDIRIISYITRGCSQMDDAFCLRALYAKRIHVRHYIMANLTLTLLSHIIVDIIRMSFHLINLLLGDVKAKLTFRLSKCDPQLSPCAELHVRRKNILHLFTCIPL